jgi:hypothetical protein
MQNLCQIGRRHWILIRISIPLALVVVNPLVGVSQNAAQKKADAKISQDGGRMPPDQKSAAKLIVGAWLGGLTGDDRAVVFGQDGTFEDLGANIFCEEHEIVSAERKYKQQVFVRGQGNWRFEGDHLVLSNSSRIPYWSSDQREPTGVRNSTCRFQIVRLDDNLLRLRVIPVETTEKTTLFFRRTEEKPIEKEFANVPPEYRRVLAAAELTPDEAASFADWLKAQKLDSPAQLEVIDRLAKARRHQITLAQLFGMTAEEAAAFREVVGQVNGDYQRLARLATNDELTSTERQAIDKATFVITDLTRLSQQLPMDVQSRASLLGRGGYEIAQQVFQEAINSGNFGGGFGGAGGAAAFQAAVANANQGADAGPAAGGARGGRGGGFAAGRAQSGFAASRGRGGRRGSVLQNLAPNAETLTDTTQLDAVVKLNAYVADLGGWFWRTVFPTE